MSQRRIASFAMIGLLIILCGYANADAQDQEEKIAGSDGQSDGNLAQQAATRRPPSP